MLISQGEGNFCPIMTTLHMLFVNLLTKEKRDQKPQNSIIVVYGCPITYTNLFASVRELTSQVLLTNCRFPSFTHQFVLKFAGNYGFSDQYHDFLTECALIISL